MKYVAGALGAVFTLLFLVSSAEAGSRIVGGSPAPEGSWPSQALVRQGNSYCGGTVVHPRWVVTAAHCMRGATRANTTVSLGSTDFYSAVPQGVESIHVHSGFTELYENDVALLRLRFPAFVETRAIARLQDEPYFSGGQAGYIAGWGSTCSGCDGPTDQLREATVRVRSWSECALIYQSFYFHSGMICAGESGVDSCQGDSGGPLEIQGPSGRLLLGVVSWGIGCANEKYPGVYTDLSRYGNWLGSRLVSSVSSPAWKRVRGSASISVRIRSSSGLPVTLRPVARRGFRVIESSCQNVPPGGSCKIQVVDTNWRRTYGELLIRSAAKIKLASVELLG